MIVLLAALVGTLAGWGLVSLIVEANDWCERRRRGRATLRQLGVLAE